MSTRLLTRTRCQAIVPVIFTQQTLRAAIVAGDLATLRAADAAGYTFPGPAGEDSCWLELACEHGQLAAVRFLLEELHPRLGHPALPATIEMAAVAMGLACRHGHAEVATYLVAKVGASLLRDPPKAADDQGQLVCPAGAASLAR